MAEETTNNSQNNKIDNTVVLGVDYSSHDFNNIKSESETVNKGDDRGFINKNSSTMLKKDGVISNVSGLYSQSKITPDGKKIDISLEHRVKTNRFALETEDIIVNNHKLNNKLVDLTDFRPGYGLDNYSIGNLKLAGTVLVKAWDYNLKKYVLIRRPIHLAPFGTEVNLPVVPKFLNMNNNIDNYDITSKAVSKDISVVKDTIEENTTENTLTGNTDKVSTKSKSNAGDVIKNAVINNGTGTSSNSSGNTSSTDTSAKTTKEPLAKEVKTTAETKETTEKTETITTKSSDSTNTEVSSIQKRANSLDTKLTTLRTERISIEKDISNNDKLIEEKLNEINKFNSVKDVDKKNKLLLEVEELQSKNKTLNEKKDDINSKIKKTSVSSEIANRQLDIQNKVQSAIDTGTKNIVTYINEEFEEEVKKVLDEKIKEIQEKYSDKTNEVIDAKINAVICSVNNALFKKEKDILKSIEQFEINTEHKLNKINNSINDPINNTINKIFGDKLGKKMNIDSSKYVNSIMSDMKTDINVEIQKYYKIKSEYFEKVNNIKKTINDYKEKKKKQLVNWAKTQWNNSKLKAKLSSVLNPIKDKIKAQIVKLVGNIGSWLKDTLRFK